MALQSLASLILLLVWGRRSLRRLHLDFLIFCGFKSRGCKHRSSRAELRCTPKLCRQHGFFLFWKEKLPHHTLHCQCRCFRKEWFVIFVTKWLVSSYHSGRWLKCQTTAKIDCQARWHHWRDCSDLVRRSTAHTCCSRWEPGQPAARLYSCRSHWILDRKSSPTACCSRCRRCLVCKCRLGCRHRLARL